MSISLIDEVRDLFEFIFLGGGVKLPLPYDDFARTYFENVYKERGSVPIILIGTKYHSKRLRESLRELIMREVRCYGEFSNGRRIEYKSPKMKRELTKIAIEELEIRCVDELSDDDKAKFSGSHYIIETEYFQEREADKELWAAQEEIKKQEYSEFLRRPYFPARPSNEFLVEPDSFIDELEKITTATT